MTSKPVQIISALGASQGSLAVIAALLAALSGHFVSNVHPEDLNNANPYVKAVFYICGSVATALPLFTAIICSLSEQEAKVAYAFSLMHESNHYDLNLESWWRKFASLRTQAVWAFYTSIPFVFVSVAFYFYISSGKIAATFICIIGVLLTKSVSNLSNLFRENVLLMDHSSSALTVPVYFSDKKVILAHNIVTGYNESLKSDKNSRSRNKNLQRNIVKDAERRSSSIRSSSRRSSSRRRSSRRSSSTRSSSRRKNDININETEEEMEHFVNKFTAALS